MLEMIPVDDSLWISCEAPEAGQASNTCPAIYNTASSSSVPSSPDAKVIASMVDWLTCSISSEFALPDTKVIEAMRLLHESDTGVLVSPWSFGGDPLMLKAGSKLALFVLHNDYLDFRVLQGAGSTIAQVTVYSPYIWQVGASQAAQDMQLWCDAWFCDPVVLVPSRLDLCRDVVGFPLELFDSFSSVRQRFVTPSRWKYVKGEEQLVGEDVDVRGSSRVESLYIGAPGGAVRLNIYNKSTQAKKKGADYYCPTWRRGGWLDGEEITRVEYRCGRAFFREWRNVDTGEILTDVHSLLGQLSAIWQYLTHKFARMVVPNPGDSNRTRAETDSAWVIVQAAFTPEQDPHDSTRVSRRRLLVKQLEDQCAGVVRSLLAVTLQGECDRIPLDYVGGYVADVLKRVCEDKERSLEDLVTERQAEILAGRS